MEKFQRIGSISNAHVGRDFEKIAFNYFAKLGFQVDYNVGIELGIKYKKKHCFDLGSTANADKQIIIECKSHRWTTGDNTPSAKMTVWNEAMYYFSLVPANYRKILFVLRDFSKRRNETLAEYYIRTYGHLIPHGVEIMEYDEDNETVTSYIK